ncbi:hypothetical protein GCM10027586_03590 [Kineococcus gypseus]|uniref:hypothetical protein n=1 Tax=Kineococcus gypseus TaxID=1637102 RepID=UPI003D7D36AC
MPVHPTVTVDGTRLTERWSSDVDRSCDVLGVLITRPDGSSYDATRRTAVPLGAAPRTFTTDLGELEAGTYRAEPFHLLGGSWSLGGAVPFTVGSGERGHAGARDPRAAPAALAVSAMPATARTGWVRVYAEDFTTYAARGQFQAKYPAVKDYGNSTVKQDTFRRGAYNAAATMSAHDSVADCHFRVVDGVPTGNVIVPHDWFNATPGHRFEMRYRVTSSTSPNGFKMAAMLWPSSDVWAEGEVDYPEGDFTGRQQGFVHRTIAGREDENAHWFNGASNWAWHTAAIEWTRGLLVFTLDGREVSRYSGSSVPTTPHQWRLQVETELNHEPIASTAGGHLEIDYFVIERKR